LASLLDSWELALKGERKSAHTIRVYTTGVRLYLTWCQDTGISAELSKLTVQAFTAELLDEGAEAATAVARLQALRRFSAWLTEEGELDADPLLGIRRPKLDRKVTQALADDEIKLLLKACSGKDLVDKRDEAIVRLMCESGLRAGEVVGLHTADVDLKRGEITIRRGKGGKGRMVGVSAQTSAAIDRYLRARRTHRLADTGPMWVGGGGKTFGYHGLAKSLGKRAELAGLKNFHLHLLRHTAATRWLRRGGSEGGLMSICGWSSREMLDRYTSSSASERAVAEGRGLNLGDF
jgi:site-specific recombinase XerD